MIQEILVLCKNRLVLFDNKTKDESKRVEQVQELLSLVNMVIAQNGGQPYTDELFSELKVIFSLFMEPRCSCCFAIFHQSFYQNIMIATFII